MLAIRRSHTHSGNYRYRIWRRVFHLLTTILFKVEYIGCSNVPRKGPVLLCMNHECYVDPFFAAVGVPWRVFSFLAMKPVWNSRLLGYLMNYHWNGIPVDQERLGLDTLRAVQEWFRTDGAILLFPEGERTIDGKMNSGRPGVGFLLSRFQVPVVPVRICGGYAAWPRGGSLRFRRTVTIEYGTPITADELNAHQKLDRKSIGQISDRIMALIANLPNRCS